MPSEDRMRILAKPQPKDEKSGPHDEHPTTTTQEINAWYSIDWDNSVYSTVGIGGFLPLLLQSCGLAAAGYPSICPNVITNATVIRQVFGANTTIASMYYLNGYEPECTSTAEPTCINGYCKGYPASTNDCRYADGGDAYPLRVIGTSVDPTAFATLSISLSVAAQVLVFIALGAVADYGSARKTVLIIASLLGGVFSLLCCGITPDAWWSGMPLMILTNVCFGLTSIMYNAYLSPLVKAHPRVKAVTLDDAPATGGGEGAAGATGAATITGPPAAATQASSSASQRAIAAPAPAAAGSADAFAYTNPITTGTGTGGAAGDVASLGYQAQAAAAAGSGGVATAVSAIDSTTGASAVAVAPAAPGHDASTAAHHLADNLAALVEKRAVVEQKVADELSNIGFAWGYIAGLIGIVLCAPFAFFLNEIPSYQVAMAITGVWWLIFVYKPWRYLLPRPGPPLPPGRTYFTQSLYSVVDTARDLWKLKTSLAFVLLWMLYSDASFLIGSIGGLYANSEVEWGCFSKSIGILVMFIVVPIFAAFGNWFLLRIGQRFDISGKSMLILVLVICSLIPAYAMIGFASKSVGVRKGWEMILVACVYGFTIGPIQSYSRSVFSTMVPRGRETAFFSLYELTNKGSSALGPLVMTAIQQATGELRYAWIFVITNIFIPAMLLFFINEKLGARQAEEASNTWAAPGRGTPTGTVAGAKAAGASGDDAAATPVAVAGSSPSTPVVQAAPLLPPATQE